MFDAPFTSYIATMNGYSRFALSASLLCVFQYVNGQSPEITLGPEIIHKNGFPAPKKGLGADSSGFYVQRETEDDVITLERYAHDLTLQHSSTFSPSYRGEQIEPWYLYWQADHLFLVAKALQAGTDTALFLSTRVDRQRLTPLDDWKILGRVDTKGRKPTVSLYNGLRGTTLEFGSKERGTESQFSSDASEHGRVFYTDYAMEEDERDIYDVLVVDNDMEVSWSHRVALDETEAEFDHWKTTLADNGVVYIHGKRTFGGGKAVVDGKPNYVFRVYGINETGMTMNATIDLGPKFIRACNLEVVGNVITLSGTYAEDASMETRGLYRWEIDALTGTTISRNEVQFPSELFVQLHGPDKGGKQYAKYLSSKKVGVDGLKINWTYALAGGTTRIICEIRWRTQLARTTTRPAASPSLKYEKTSYIPIYHTEQVLILDLDKNWNSMTTAVIQKAQEVAFDEGFSSVLDILATDGQHYFLFNDHVDNLSNVDLAEGKPTQWAGKKGCVSLVELQESGIQTRRAVVDIKEEETAIYTTIAVDMGEREKVVLCRYKGNERWLRLRW